MHNRQYRSLVSVYLLILGGIQAIAFLMMDEVLFAGFGLALALGAGVSLWVDTRSTGQQAV